MFGIDEMARDCGISAEEQVGRIFHHDLFSKSCATAEEQMEAIRATEEWKEYPCEETLPKALLCECGCGIFTIWLGGNDWRSWHVCQGCGKADCHHEG
jgi:hypothetical protein